jgi:hypothetical protein
MLMKVTQIDGNIVNSPGGTISLCFGVRSSDIARKCPFPFIQGILHGRARIELMRLEFCRHHTRAKDHDHLATARFNDTAQPGDESYG